MWMLNGYGMGAAGWLLMALFWIALIALVVFAVVRLSPGRSRRECRASAPRTRARSSGVDSPAARSTLTPTTS